MEIVKRFSKKKKLYLVSRKLLALSKTVYISNSFSFLVRLTEKLFKIGYSHFVIPTKKEIFMFKTMVHSEVIKMFLASLAYEK